ncbi:MAG TPA: DUF6298 domain-containing protein, partial [Prolixibacteraceae bacterium]|nr:DUF6298 domain-containing protein [Prolixibacteraceae bacterium]
AGWTAAFSLFWQCSASRIENFAPPGATNWAIGTWGQFAGNGFWHEPNSHVNPRSLFYAQLGGRIGKDKLPQNPVIEYTTNATTSPTLEQAAELVAFFQTPVKTVKEWIEEEAPRRTPIPLDRPKDAIYSTTLPPKEKENPAGTQPASTQIRYGWLAHGEKVITGESRGVPWWNGTVRPRGINRAQMALTRYVPGRIGKGYTDNLNEVMAEMGNNNIALIEQHYALWYERRRDDHERIRRMDADVWAPFYEGPFARSGKEQAWDGLSKYDLTQFNPWYWGRLKEFAGMADQNGKILFYQHFFQHHILEAGAHWVDSPWRTVNNINGTGFPEPPPFAGDKRIFIADKFYDVTHPVRRELYRSYIRKCLDNFRDNTAVIHSTSEEYTGPFEFVAFWLDVIAEWEKENNKDVLVALSATKDVQDSILADPVRSRTVDIIDIRYWSSRADGTVYAPKGGLNLAPRQFARLEKTGSRSFEQVYNDVLSYRLKYPDKAVMYSENRTSSLAWAIFMASGSLAPVPEIKVSGFLETASGMNVEPVKKEGIYRLKNENNETILYFSQASEFHFDAESSRKQNIEFIDPGTGALIRKETMPESGTIRIEKSPVVVWIHE